MASENRKNSSEVRLFKIPKRTEGDGMETDNTKDVGVGSKFTENIPTPVVPGNIVHITPKQKTDGKSGSFPYKITFSKEPRFVPYEPYKAAVNPMIATHKTLKKKSVKESGSKCITPADEDIGFDKMQLQEELPVKGDEKNKSLSKGDAIVEVSNSEIARLKEENRELESQLKFQAQVNGELKKLLVAALGEDVEVRVQSLTEDKFHLAEQLVKTAKSLSTHQEQIEWLAGQCEVWRSKFLASSILIEELAKWKAGLSQKVTDSQEVLKSLLNERQQIKKDSLAVHKKLVALKNVFDLDGTVDKSKILEYASYNIIDLCSENHRLVDWLIAQLLGAPINEDTELNKISRKVVPTDAEKSSEHVLAQSVVSFEKTDIACTAVMMGASAALTSKAPHCAHCNGVIKII